MGLNQPLTNQRWKAKRDVAVPNNLGLSWNSQPVGEIVICIRNWNKPHDLDINSTLLLSYGPNIFSTPQSIRMKCSWGFQSKPDFQVYRKENVYICMCTFFSIDGMLVVSSATQWHEENKKIAAVSAIHQSSVYLKQGVPCWEPKTCTISMTVHNAVKTWALLGSLSNYMFRWYGVYKQGWYETISNPFPLNARQGTCQHVKCPCPLLCRIPKRSYQQHQEIFAKYV